MVHKMPFENLHLLWARQKKMVIAIFVAPRESNWLLKKAWINLLKVELLHFARGKRSGKMKYTRWYHHILLLESCITSINSSHFSIFHHQFFSLSIRGLICHSLVISTSCLVSWILITYVKLHFHFQLHNLSCSISPGDKYYFSAKVLVCIIKVNLKVIR